MASARRMAPASIRANRRGDLAGKSFDEKAESLEMSKLMMQPLGLQTENSANRDTTVEVAAVAPAVGVVSLPTAVALHVPANIVEPAFARVQSIDVSGLIRRRNRCQIHALVRKVVSRRAG